MSHSFKAFFVCYFAAPQPTFGHYQGCRLTHPMLITVFHHFLTQRSLGSLKWSWVPQPRKTTGGVWIRNLLICSQCLNPLMHYPLLSKCLLLQNSEFLKSFKFWFFLLFMQFIIKVSFDSKGTIFPS